MYSDDIGLPGRSYGETLYKELILLYYKATLT